MTVLPGLASTVVLGFESRRNHDHILLSHDSGSNATLTDSDCAGEGQQQITALFSSAQSTKCEAQVYYKQWVFSEKYFRPKGMK
jgi:hypothetical protein